MDHIDKLIKQWENERPELDLAPMALLGRLTRLSYFFRQAMEKTFAEFDLNPAGFDVLATLRRSGEPYTLCPKDLLNSTLVTSGTMTNRIEQLQKAGFITRQRSQTDKRSYLISLTPKGLSTINQAVEKHVITQKRLIDTLSKDDYQQFDTLLKKMLVPFEEN